MGDPFSAIAFNKTTSHLHEHHSSLNIKFSCSLPSAFLLLLMSRTYKTIGINLKSQPMGESDRLLTILTREHGLVQAVAMGARKHNSSLAGRSGLFVVNHLLIAKGRSLDKVTQAETLESYPGLGQDLKRLTASQYIAELCLCQALSDQPQEELFALLNHHLKQLERSPAPLILPYLVQAIFQFLVLEGVAPEVYRCCITQQALKPNWMDANWRAGFSAPNGGVVTLEVLQTLQQQSPKRLISTQTSRSTGSFRQPPMLHRSISATELALLQTCSSKYPQEVDQTESSQNTESSDPLSVIADQFSTENWLSVEHLIRQYAQYHFDRPIRSASLVDACFLPSSPSPKS